MRKAHILSAGLLASLLTAGTASADTNYSIAVKQSDFRSANSVEALYKRIKRQAKDACPSYFVERNLREISQCREEVTEDLVSKINHPLLNAYVEGEDSFRVALAERDPAPRS